MKNGTAISGKLSTPAIIRCAATMSGAVPVTSRYSSEATAIATATGAPMIISSRKDPISSSMGQTPVGRVSSAAARRPRRSATKRCSARRVISTKAANTV